MICGGTGMLAPDGRCKTLDAAGDGYVRAENCLVMLLAAAEDASHSLSALVAGTAVNQVLQHATCWPIFFKLSLHQSIILDACGPQIATAGRLLFIWH